MVVIIKLMVLMHHIIRQQNHLQLKQQHLHHQVYEVRKILDSHHQLIVQSYHQQFHYRQTIKTVHQRFQ